MLSGRDRDVQSAENECFLMPFEEILWSQSYDAN